MLAAIPHDAVAESTAAQWTVRDREGALARAEQALNNYYYADRVSAMRALLERRSTSLVAMEDPEAFASALTAILQTASHDKHFIVWYSKEADENEGRETTAAEAGRLAQFFRYVAEGYDLSARLKGNVGYLRLSGFANMPAAKATIDCAMRLLAGTNGLIVDMRNNQGGDSDTVDYLLGYFFAKPTEIAITTQRLNGRFSVHREFTAADVVASRYLVQPVYVLIGKSTISGGEMFAYSLQSLHRATLIGSTTAGAANGLGSTPYFLSAHLRMSVPDTRIVNPYTRANWENGVVPDVVAASDGALLLAYERALRGAPKSLDPLGELAAALRDPASALRDSFPAL